MTFISRTRLTLIFLVILVLLGTFFLGGYANKKCAFPFCRDYFQIITARFPLLARTRYEPKPEPERDRQITTNLYQLNLKIVHSPEFGQRGGGLARYGENLLLSNRMGRLYLLDSSGQVNAIGHAIPFDWASFDELAKIVDAITPGYSATELFQGLGVHDILLRREEDNILLFASHERWHTNEKCWSLVVSMLRAKEHDFLTSKEDGQWTTVFESSPCLAAREGSHPVAAHQAGGRIEYLKDGKILLTVGDYEFDGRYDRQNLVADSGSSYGKTVSIDYANGGFEVFTTGHRNPQGLLASHDGTIWLTEHGPRGGDELNALKKSWDYGWPTVTYGTDYESFSWPLSDRQGSHRGFARPFFSWLPSIGISQLAEVTRPMFALWRGDLIVSSLARATLFRVRIREGRVVFTEPIRVNRRVRDIVELADGSFALKFDYDEVGFLTLTTPENAN